MSMTYCEICNKQVDTDYDAEHFLDQHEEPAHWFPESKVHHDSNCWCKKGITNAH